MTKHYTLTLTSHWFEDPAGHDLDGEPGAAAAVPSGNGLPGGDFTVGFRVEHGPDSYAAPLQPVEPRGGLVYRGSLSTQIAAPGDVDPLTLPLESQHSVTVVVHPAATLRPTVELLDPDGAVVASATATAAGEASLVQSYRVPIAGQYTIRVGGAGNTSGASTVEVILGAAVEEEEYGGPPNNLGASSQDLDATFVPLGSGAGQRTAVLGQTRTISAVDEEAEN